ncbi:hypothetical protein SeMB42_g06441 [Synchytrium endobioticum]|uniref:DUF4219 domain-containing protein n=1 Tax=Synchytrium endobioticum TaxID=286115 RepID=A0A507CHW6_9FUNG|nr:hypothetical protein SeMB42_g06441 [Synchytrium endobioticum]
MRENKQQRLGEDEVTLDQYQNWAVLVKVALRKKDLWDVVSGEEEWKDIEAVETFLNHISFNSDVFTTASKGDDAFETWQLIEFLFVAKNRDLSNAVNTLAIDEGDATSDRHWQLEKLQAITFITGLNESYDSYKLMVASNTDGE